MEEKQAKNKSWLSRQAAKLKRIFRGKERKKSQEVAKTLEKGVSPFEERAQQIAQERGSFNDKEYKDLINHIQNHPLQNEYQIEVGHDTRGGWLKVTYTNPEGASREIKVEADGDRAKELGITYKMGDKPLYLPPKTFYLQPAMDGRSITKLTEAEKEKDRRFRERAQQIAKNRNHDERDYDELINHIQNHPLQNEYKVEVKGDSSGLLTVKYKNSTGAEKAIVLNADGPKARELGITMNEVGKTGNTFYLRPAEDGGITKLTEAEREKENREKEFREKEIKFRKKENKEDRQAVKAVKAIKPMSSVVFFNTRGGSVKKDTQFEGKIKNRPKDQLIPEDRLIMEISSDNKNGVVRVLLDKKHEKMLGIDDENRKRMGGKTVSFTVKPGGKVSANITTAENKSTVSQVKSKGRSGI
jgi:hypothetical protein